MATHQSLPKTANAKKKSDILPIPAQSKSHPVIAQPKIESTLSNEEQLAQMRANREASERMGSTLLTPESVPRTLPPLQPKLTIGQPNDQYEQEADRVARQVVDHINAPPKIQAKTQRYPMSVAQRKPSPLAHHPVSRVQRYATGGEMDASPDLESSIQRARGGGQPLDDGIRARMEGAFGADFSGVRVHTNGTSDQLNQSIQAKAFTTGQDVFFRKGMYEPGSRGGQELLAHELTHVVQQKGEAVQRKTLTDKSDTISTRFISQTDTSKAVVQRGSPTNEGKKVTELTKFFEQEREKNKSDQAPSGARERSQKEREKAIEERKNRRSKFKTLTNFFEHKIEENKPNQTPPGARKQNKPTPHKNDKFSHELAQIVEKSPLNESQAVQQDKLKDLNPEADFVDENLVESSQSGLIKSSDNEQEILNYFNVHDIFYDESIVYFMQKYRVKLSDIIFNADGEIKGIDIPEETFQKNLLEINNILIRDDDYDYDEDFDDDSDEDFDDDLSEADDYIKNKEDFVNVLNKKIKEKIKEYKNKEKVSSTKGEGSKLKEVVYNFGVIKDNKKNKKKSGGRFVGYFVEDIDIDPFEEERQTMHRGRFTGIPKKKPNFKGRNLASYELDVLLDANVTVPTFPAKHDNKDGFVMARAVGIEGREKIDDPFGSDAQDRLTPQGKKSLSNLYLLDFITGQVDRHPGNFLVSRSNIDNPILDEYSVVTAIDNDLAFGEWYGEAIRTVNPFRIKEVEDQLKKLESQKLRADNNRQQEIKHHVEILHQKIEDFRNTKNVIKNIKNSQSRERWSHGKSPWELEKIDKAFAVKIMKLNFDQEVRPILEKHQLNRNEIKATQQRLEVLKNFLNRELEKLEHNEKSKIVTEWD